MPTKTFGYARVSSKEQNLDRQIDALKKYVDERDIISEKQSGKDFERPAYQMLRMMLREGDTLYLTSLDRLSRSKKEIKLELENLKALGVQVKILDMPTTMLDYSQYGGMQKIIMEMVNNILIEVVATISENERNMLRKRQAEGIAAAKARGKHLGRPRKQYPINWIAVYSRWSKGEITAAAAMRELKMKKTSFYKLAKIYKQQLELNRIFSQ